MCKPKIRRLKGFLNFITGGGITGITLAPFGIYIKEKYISNLRTVNHEKIHWCQQLEMLIIFFYLWYLIEWIIRIFVNGSEAYRSLSFEREAYDNDDNQEYLKTRKTYSWLKYIRLKKRE